MQYDDFIKYADENCLNIHELADKIGISVNALYNYKNDKKLRTKTATKLKNFYDMYIAQTTDTITQTVQGKFEKVSLLDEVAIIDSLNKGKTVISFSTGKRFKLIDGLIVTYTSTNIPLFINSAVDLTDKDGYYCLQPVPVKLKVSKKYVTADNKIGIVFAADEDEYYVVFEGDKKLRKYDINGKCLDDDGLDLITEMD
jgi:protein involved in sex pheromone biosynthesis